MPRGVVAIAAMIAISCGSTGCFGYTRGAKGWSYVGNVLLIGAGATAIALDKKSEPECEGMGCQPYKPPFSGGIAIGAVAVAAGLVGIVLNATRPTAKPSSQGR
jgi:hypothetical protein